MKKIKIISLLVLALTLFISCDKEENNASSPRLEVKLTDEYAGTFAKNNDAGFIYDEVNVEIEQVAVFYGGPKVTGTWVELETNAGIYNLMELQNLMVVIADAEELPTGHITQIRLTLGNENSVVLDSVSYDLITPSAQQSGLKFNLDITMEAESMYELVIDFDAMESVVIQGTGAYILNPVIHVASVVEIQP